MNKQKGFTLIELVMVIVILGILAAFAVPRFADVTSDARKATVDAVAGSLRSAAALAHATALSQAKTASQAISMEGVTINMTQFYPTSSTLTDGITLALVDRSGFTLTLSGGTTTVYFTKDGAANPDGCYVFYTAPTTANTAPTISSVKNSC